MANKVVKAPKLYPWQKDIVEAIKEAGTHSHKIFVAKSKRQCGKSFICEMELLRHSLEYPNSTSICISITYQNVEKIFKELVKFIGEAPFVAGVNAGTMTIDFKNKSSIVFKSAASGDNLRGLTVTGSGLLVIDEAAYLKDEIFAIVLPYTNVNKNNVLMVSTPRAKSGIFYTYYQQGLNNPNGSIVSFDMAKYDTSEVLDDSMIETYRKILPKNQFVTEILGEFADDIGGVFDLSKKIFRDKEKPSKDIFIGIDWGTGKNDFTCVSCFDINGVQVGVDYTNNLNPLEQISWITNIIKGKYSDCHIQKIICETNSIGNVYIPLLKTSIGLGYNYLDFTTTNQSKREIIEYLIRRVNEESIKFINESEMYVELGGYQIEITKNGNITYNGMFGTHDDLIMASAFAMYGVKQLMDNSNYMLSFGNKDKKERRRERWNKTRVA